MNAPSYTWWCPNAGHGFGESYPTIEASWRALYIHAKECRDIQAHIASLREKLSESTHDPSSAESLVRAIRYLGGDV